jgi:hypothetical protein
MTEAERVLIGAAWDKLQADWQSDEAHRRFVALCATYGALGEAGSRYRALREADPSRSAEIELRQKAVMAAALAEMSNAQTPRPGPTKRIMWLMVGACGFVVIQAILALLRVRSQ